MLALGWLLGACDTEPNVVRALGDLAPVAQAKPVVPRIGTCPEAMALVGGACVDRWEAHLIDAETGKALPFQERPPSRAVYAAKSARGVKPQGYISRREAAQACTNAGKRLCRAREWHRACVGSKRTRYPYGDEERPSACNTQKPHLPNLLFGAHTPLTYAAHYNSPKLALREGFLAETGSHPECITDEGLADMVGNLHEWVADDVSPRLKREVPLELGDHQLGARGRAVFMGGYFSSKSEHGRGCAYATTHHAADYHDYSTGFRCCSDEPR